MNSGLLKLTCPLLVNAIDQLEDDGYIANFTDQVESNKDWKESCQAQHATHAQARKSILTSSDKDSMSILQQRLGDRGAQAFVNSGIVGATVEKPEFVICYRNSIWKATGCTVGNLISGS